MKRIEALRKSSLQQVIHVHVLTELQADRTSQELTLAEVDNAVARAMLVVSELEAKVAEKSELLEDIKKELQEEVRLCLQTMHCSSLAGATGCGIRVPDCQEHNHHQS